MSSKGAKISCQGTKMYFWNTFSMLLCDDNECSHTKLLFAEFYGYW